MQRRQNTNTSLVQRWKRAARSLKSDALALYFATRHPDVPWYAKAIAAAVVAYAFSPIDLIPDAIPVFGFLDDLILVPLGMSLALRLVPPPVMAECRQRARETLDRAKPKIWAAAAVIAAIWIVVAVLVVRLLIGLARHA